MKNIKAKIDQALTNTGDFSEITSPVIETPTIEDFPEITPIFIETTKKNPLVEVRTLYNHKCCIGGVFYVFTANIPVLVPKHVKMTLRKQQLLKA
jgi:hypothetical protein